MTPKPTKTEQARREGAQWERDCTRAKVRRMLRQAVGRDGIRFIDGDELLQWLNGRAKRYRQREGGL